MKKKETSFEESILSLEKVIKKLESTSTSLDEMIQLYEDGINLTNVCKSKLDVAEQRITKLVNDKGQLKEVSGI